MLVSDYCINYWISLRVCKQNSQGNSNAASNLAQQQYDTQELPNSIETLTEQLVNLQKADAVLRHCMPTSHKSHPEHYIEVQQIAKNEGVEKDDWECNIVGLVPFPIPFHSNGLHKKSALSFQPFMPMNIISITQRCGCNHVVVTGYSNLCM